MNIKGVLSDETFWYIVAIAWFILIGVNVNTTLGLIYISFPVVAALITIFDKNKTIKFDKDGKWGKAILYGGIIYVVFILANLFLVRIYEHINVGGIIALLGASAPALAQSKILNFFTFFMPVSFVESMAIIRMFDFAATKFNIGIDKQSLFKLSTIFLIVVFSFGYFLLLHVTAKGINSNSELMIVGVMMFTSLTLAVWWGEAKQVVIFHMIANGLALLTTLGFVALSNI